MIDSGTRADQTIVVRELRTRLGDRVGTSEATLQQHSHDESHHSPALPWAVVSCVAESDVQAALEICSRHRVPVVPFGVGSGLEGGAIPSAGGISLDLSAMNR
ncbi:MAG: FAD-binding oxidoreductase, partial [Candidatus Dormibacteria bacterium]